MDFGLAYYLLIFAKIGYNDNFAFFPYQVDMDELTFNSNGLSLAFIGQFHPVSEFYTALIKMRRVNIN
jgi:hypothetical protein